MERILVFLKLKVIEIVVFILLPYGVGCLMNKLGVVSTENKLVTWGVGLVSVVVLSLIGFIAYLIIIGNWELAGKLVCMRKLVN